MSAMDRKLVGIIGSGLIGRDPFDPRSWSTISRYFFTTLRQAGLLHRAFGVEAPKITRYACMIKNFDINKSRWKRSFYMDRAYRDALTREIRRRLEPADFEHDFLQIGAMYDVPSLTGAHSRCYSYHDGNLAESLRSPNSPRGLGARKIDTALAYERRVYHGIHKILCMSEYLRQSFIKDFDVPAERVEVIGAGINLEAIPEPVLDKRYDSREVLFIGVDFPRKGGWELLQAFKRVRARIADARLHLVGPKELAIPPDLQGGVTFHGYLSKNVPADKARLDELFRRSCLFVMPSRYEPFGIAPLEAMVHQVPCLVTNRWALKEMVIPGLTGDHVECDDVEDLKAKLSALLADPEALRAMGEKGRQFVVENFTWDHVIKRLIRAVSA
jgi:glycosyltransferase involved in cell wall biosynthesis